MIERSADELVRLYFRLRQKASEAPGLNLSLDAYPAPKCRVAACTSTRHQLSVSTKKGDRYTCAKCGADWKMIRARGAGSGGRRNRSPGEATMNLMIELGLALNRVPLWPRRALVLYAMYRVLLDFQGEVSRVLHLTPVQRRRMREALAGVPCERRDDDVARIALAVWPRRVGGWHRRAVKELLDGRYLQRSAGARSAFEQVLAGKAIVKR